MFSSAAAVAARRERALPKGRLKGGKERPLPAGRERALPQAQERPLLEGRERPLPEGCLVRRGERPLLEGRDRALPEGRLDGRGERPLLEGRLSAGGGMEARRQARGVEERGRMALAHLRLFSVVADD